MKDISSFFAKKAEKLKAERKFEEAIQFTDKANEIKKEENSDDFWYKRAIHFCELGEYEEAVECLDNDLTLHKKSYETFFLKGLILYELTDYEESIECFNKAAEERNQRYLQSNKKIKYMKKTQKFEKALIYTDLAHNEKPLSENFWYHKGLPFLKLKKYGKALECFTNAIKINDNDSKLFYSLSKCELFLGNEEKCLEFLEKACSLDSVSKEKLKVDNDFSSLWNDKQFRVILGL
jgi:tetratricopeptide (TPR) repeat protein